MQFSAETLIAIQKHLLFSLRITALSPLAVEMCFRGKTNYIFRRNFEI